MHVETVGNEHSITNCSVHGVLELTNVFYSLTSCAPEENPASKRDFEKSTKKYHGLLKKQEQLLRGKFIILNYYVLTTSVE